MSQPPVRSTPGSAAPAVTVALRHATTLSRVLVVVVLLVQLLAPGAVASAAPVVLVVGLVLGIPHGAVDHVVLARRQRWSGLRTAVGAALYGTAAVAVWLLFRAAPEAGLLAFVALSVWHFGTGETAVADLRAGRAPTWRPALAVLTGAVVLLVPLLRAGSTTAEVVDLVASGAAWPAASWAGPLAAGVLTVVAGAVVLLVARRRPAEAVDLVLLALLAGLVHPLAAFGLWFGGWHAVRHTARIVAEDPGNDRLLLTGRPVRALLRTARAGALPSAGALLVAAVLWWTADGWAAFVASDLLLLAALTVPHVAVTTWTDVQEQRRPHLVAAHRS